MAKEKLERIVHIRPPTDSRDKDCGFLDSQVIRMIIRGQCGAVEFAWRTGIEVSGKKSSEARAISIGYHSPHRTETAHNKGPCDVLPGKKCYNFCKNFFFFVDARDYYDLLIAKGSDAVWDKLEEYYNETFHTVKEG